MSNSTDAARDFVTVKGHFNSLCDTYIAEVVNSSLASTDATLNAQIRSLVAEFELFWRHLSAVGAFSPNDEIDDYSTTALEMLWTPYILADLFQRVQGPMKRAQDSRAGNDGDSSNGTAQQQACSADERMRGEDVLRPSEQDSGVQQMETVAHSAANLTSRSLREEELRSLSRQEALARSHAWLKVFFEWMENIELVDKKTLDTHAVYRADQRSQRVELSRTIASLRAALKAEEDKWSIYEGCHQLQISSRELSMLEALNPEQRAAISKQYQDTMDSVRRGELSLGRHTYTILPGGMMAAGTVDHPRQVRTSDIVQSGGVTAPAATATAATSSSLAIRGSRNAQLYRQQIRNELMIDRNAPTMTLQEFAELEMAEIQRQVDEAQAKQQRQAEEDARLGPDGVEERQRQKDSAWADWKDDHPAYGLTNKGNYS
ncbi:TAP42-like family protein [Leishmania donovani]|uniref:TAP42-like family protein n=1 Tax=Leishmania donovani TaxID=5661 RepID=A0A504WVN7_LEIDO|nr:TAP42-like family protein [Leishmania donovani]